MGIKIMNFGNFLTGFSRMFAGNMLFSMAQSFGAPFCTPFISPFPSPMPFFNPFRFSVFNNSLLYMTPNSFWGISPYNYDMAPPEPGSYTFATPDTTLFNPQSIQSIWDDPPEFLINPQKYNSQSPSNDLLIFDTYTTTSESKTTSSATQKADKKPVEDSPKEELKTKTKESSETLGTKTDTQQARQQKTEASIQPNKKSVQTRKNSNSQVVSSNPEASRNKRSAGKNWTDMTDSEMRQTYGNYDRDITILYNGTSEQLNRYLVDKGVLKGKGQVFLNAQKKYKISASTLIGICMNESNKGTSRLARQLNNLAGIRKFHNNGKWEWRKFSSVEECIDYIANLLRKNYVQSPGNGKVKNLTKLYQINAKYCPVTDPAGKDLNLYWARNVDKYTREVENLA